MFNYYDIRMTRRLDQLKVVTNKNTEYLERILDTAKNIYDDISMKVLLNRFYATIGTPNSVATPTIVDTNLLGSHVQEAEKALH